MTPHVMKRDGCKVQLKQRESMTQITAPPSQTSLAAR